MEDEDARLPSPDKKPSVFVFHESAPERVVRIPLIDDWEAFLEVVRSRLKLRTSDVVMDTSTGTPSLPRWTGDERWTSFAPVVWTEVLVWIWGGGVA